MVKNILKILAIFIIGTVGGIFADQILWPYFIERPLFYQYRLEQSPVYVTERKEIIIQENVALINAIEKVEKVVAGVKTKTKAGEILEGSGLIVTSDGLLVTLANLVPSSSTFSFFVDGEIVHFQVLKRDLKENLALVKIEKTNLPTVGFADLEKIKLGERIFLLGVIFEQGIPKKIVNEGIIKTFDENSVRTNISEKKILEGSPLFNIEGQVVGLNQIDREGKVSAISIKKIREFLGF
ncbi:trypsin-like peptidase domain-containing protein [Patescibacteria group bacterium]|nr:trypsin-like peptidase domain-containing protein [Patescibacteria group bacterium]